ncbi:unnamed protein product [Mytilus edulis]|uniref:Uncharacterized protein n=1 Tax=Mytilus edulis TaxID=6550 RepID=A0A8S3TBB6_MYTED|nr:unnamed protein product [Mytilus edulis]
MDLRPRMKLSDTESLRPRAQVEENSPRSAGGLHSVDVIEDEDKPKQVDPLEELTTHERDLASPFSKQNVALVFVTDRKKKYLYPGKTQSFCSFLRYLSPGFDDEFSDDTVHDMLALADEYQTDDLKKRIEKFLVTSALSKSDAITSEQIILDIIEAEMYKLSEYLNVSIAIASRKKIISLTKSHKFEEISHKTQRKISFKRCKDIDKIFNKAVKVSHRFKQYQENKNIFPFGLGSTAPKQYEIDIKMLANI